jgi:predicted metallopeptidase
MCTQEARAGLNIVVKDSRDNLFLRDSVKVIAASGSYTEALDNFPGNPPTFIGAWEREGTYTITVTHPRYQTCVLSPIYVLKDACHVIAQSQTVALLPK